MAQADVPAGEPGKMSFAQYMTALGSGSDQRLSQATGVPPDVIERAMQGGKPIPLSSAKLIVAWLAKQFERDIQLKHVTELPTVNPGGQLPQQQGGTNDGNL